jgi:hypothetical protein
MPLPVLPLAAAIGAVALKVWAGVSTQKKTWLVGPALATARLKFVERCEAALTSNREKLGKEDHLLLQSDLKILKEGAGDGWVSKEEIISLLRVVSLGSILGISISTETGAKSVYEQALGLYREFEKTLNK